ncbi:AIR carboxylase family protein [Candidatus Micrarchaeota archaeon]|nr:AIR carboxylase family protein [Candidatus Micrarchaeota archaeon]
MILMGSKSDLDFANRIGAAAEEFGVSVEYAIASAHRTPKKVLQIAEEANSSKEPIVFIAVAGLSNALSGMLACATFWPIVTCPPGSSEDLPSSLRMPPGVAHGTVLGEQNAALYAVKILSLGDPALRKKVGDFLKQKAEKLEKDNSALKG